MRLKFFLYVFLLPLVFLSCGYKKPVSFPVHGAGGKLFGLSKEAAAGKLNLSNPKKLEYSFNDPLLIPSLWSLDIAYSFSGDISGDFKSSAHIVVDIPGGDSWALPWDASFLSDKAQYARIHYSVPLPELPLKNIRVSLVSDALDGKWPGFSGSAVFVLQSLEIHRRWYGFSRKDGLLYAAPFVHQKEGDEFSFVINPPLRFQLTGRTELAVSVENAFLSGVSAGKAIEVETGGLRFTAAPSRAGLYIPQGLFSGDPYPIDVSGEGIVSLNLTQAESLPFPLPITADPGVVAEYPKEKWRDRRYEIFRWESFPDILIFDTADYAVQDRLLKRLAFFVEKQGFRGRLAPDAEIQDLHGWNAHDYRALDLANFFEAARQSDFPLLAEEKELQAILLNEKIINRASDGRFVEGKGAVISISRESAEYLRNLFMVHEGFHGIFFIDEDFRNFSRGRWEKLGSAGKRFILSYFDYQHYDIADEYLVINEFMAHVLQQPASQASGYFGQTLASRIDASSWRRTVLPEKDEQTLSWPVLAETFSAEAEAFSSYVNRRWGLAAGRVKNVRVQKED
jgi:hypothetical protein